MFSTAKGVNAIITDYDAKLISEAARAISAFWKTH